MQVVIVGLSIGNHHKSCPGRGNLGNLKMNRSNSCLCASVFSDIGKLGSEGRESGRVVVLVEKEK